VDLPAEECMPAIGQSIMHYSTVEKSAKAARGKYLAGPKDRKGLKESARFLLLWPDLESAA